MHMRKMAGMAVAAILLLAAGATNAVRAATPFSDHFDGNSINPSLWVTHGWQNCFSGGDWAWSFTEANSRLTTRVWGPTSGISRGATAWVRTVADFNDGKTWVLNFNLGTTITYTPQHIDAFAIQITDGTDPDSPDCLLAAFHPVAGTVSLWRTAPATSVGPSIPDTPLSPMPQSDWSVKILPTGTAYLYQAPNAEGTSYSQTALDISKSWYFRFLESDATSSGFTAGDNTIALDYFAATPEPASLSLLALGGLALLRR